MARRSRLLWVLPTVLAVTACGAAAPSSHLTAMGNKLAAQRDAEHLLHLFVLPARARRLASAPLQTHRLLQEPGSRLATPNIIDRHGVWLVQSPLASVVAFVKGHVPSGSRQAGGGWQSGPDIPGNRQLVFSFPAIRGEISTRWLSFTAVALSPRRTGLRIDAEDVWLVPRSPSERIPSGVHEIDVRSAYPGRPANMEVSVVNPVKVGKIVRWIDALGVAQPGLTSCPELSGPMVTVDFRAATHALLARASALDSQNSSGPCNAIQLSIHGRRQTPLITGSFLKKVESLLGVSFRR